MEELNEKEAEILSTEESEQATRNAEEGAPLAEGFDIAAEEECLHAQFLGTEGKSLSELVNEKRYIELRTLGLDTKEAFRATAKRDERTYDNRSHLSASVMRSVHAPSTAMSQAELSEARELFGGMSDEEIRNLYQKVTKQR